MQRNNKISNEMIIGIASLIMILAVSYISKITKDRQVLEARAVSFAAGCLTGVTGVTREDADELYKMWCTEAAVQHAAPSSNE